MRVGNACAVNLKDSNTSTDYGYDRKSIATSITMSCCLHSDGREGRYSCAEFVYRSSAYRLLLGRALAASFCSASKFAGAVHPAFSSKLIAYRIGTAKFDAVFSVKIA